MSPVNFYEREGRGGERRKEKRRKRVGHPVLLGPCPLDLRPLSTLVQVGDPPNRTDTTPSNRDPVIPTSDWVLSPTPLDSIPHRVPTLRFKPTTHSTPTEPGPRPRRVGPEDSSRGKGERDFTLVTVDSPDPAMTTRHGTYDPLCQRVPSRVQVRVTVGLIPGGSWIGCTVGVGPRRGRGTLCHP